MTEAKILAACDPHIRFLVEVLRLAGIRTFSSCQGTRGHSHRSPHVAFTGTPADAVRAARICRREATRYWGLRDDLLIELRCSIEMRRILSVREVARRLRVGSSRARTAYWAIELYRRPGA